MQIGQPHQFLSIVAVLFDGPLMGSHSEAITALIRCLWRFIDIHQLHILIQVLHKCSQHKVPNVSISFLSVLLHYLREWKAIAEHLHICWKACIIKWLNILDIISGSLDLDYKVLFSSCVHRLLKKSSVYFLQQTREHYRHG